MRTASNAASAYDHLGRAPRGLPPLNDGALIKTRVHNRRSSILVRNRGSISSAGSAQVITVGSEAL
jgi:hypothetical protein